MQCIAGPAGNFIGRPKLRRWPVIVLTDAYPEQIGRRKYPRRFFDNAEFELTLLTGLVAGRTNVRQTA